MAVQVGLAHPAPRLPTIVINVPKVSTVYQAKNGDHAQSAHISQTTVPYQRVTVKIVIRDTIVNTLMPNNQLAFVRPDITVQVNQLNHDPVLRICTAQSNQTTRSNAQAAIFAQRRVESHVEPVPTVLLAQWAVNNSFNARSTAIALRDRRIRSFVPGVA